MSNKLIDEFYWASAILRKLLPFYQLETQFLMTFPDITLEQIHNYFAERVFDSFEPGKPNALYQIAAPSDVPPKPNPYNPTRAVNIYNRKIYAPKSNDVYPSLSSYLGTSQSQRYLPARSLQHNPMQQENQLPNERDIPIRAFNPAVPILRGPRVPPPRGTSPRAEGNKCIGCGMTGHSTYTCPYGNYPFCYRCKRFGHIRAECRDEWLRDVPGDLPMPHPPVIPSYLQGNNSQQHTARPRQGNELLALQDRPASSKDNGNFIRLSCLARNNLSTDLFLLDSGASVHVVRDKTLLSNYVHMPEQRSCFTADGSSTLHIQGFGSMIIRCDTRNSITFLMLSKVLHAPDIPLNVISVSNLCLENSISILFTNSSAIFYRSEVILPTDMEISNRTRNDVPTVFSDSTITDKTELPELSTDLRHSINFSTPFFTVNRTYNNLYSFKLPIYQCSFNNISLSSSPVPKFNSTIPPGSCQAVLLKQSTGQSELTNQRINDAELHLPLTTSSTVLNPLFRTTSGQPKDHPSYVAQALPKNITTEQRILLWHNRLAHAAMPAIKETLRLQDPNFKFPPKFELPFCDICVQSKQTYKTCDQIRTLPSRPAEIIAADIIGPVSPVTFPRGYKFILTVIDIYSKFARVFLLKCKSETQTHLRTFFNMAQAQFPTPGQFKFFRSDGGTEFTCSRVQNLLREFGMEHQCSAPGMSSHNGTIECFNRTIQEKARALLLQSGFQTSMWGLAVGAAEYIYNRTPHSAIGMKTPYQKWTGLQPDLRHISVFGSLTYNLNANRTTGKKFQQVSDPYFLAGFTETGYVLYDPKTRKTVTASSVKIDESRQYGDLYPSKVNPEPWLTSTVPQTEQTDTIQSDMETPISPSIQVEAQIHPEPSVHSANTTETKRDIPQEEHSHIQQQPGAS